MRIARYRAVPLKIDHRRSISTVNGRLREKSTVDSRLRKKKGRRRGRKNISPACRPRPPAVVARGSPTRRHHLRSRPLFLPREETEHLPARGERSSR
ncbi:hypothetical protein BHM03_00006580, partial [Ensete ventricosum]